MFYLYVDLCVLADVDIVASAINASTAIRLLYVDRSVHQAWPVARELELGRLCQESDSG